jgi:hypothetical protein
MGAKLKATTYKELTKLFAKTPRDSITIGHNTQAIRLVESHGQAFCNPDIFGIILHSSRIVELDNDGNVSFSLAGWNTVTTRQRINLFLPPGFHLYNKLHEPKLSRPDGPIEDVNDYGWITCSPNNGVLLARKLYSVS